MKLHITLASLAILGCSPTTQDAAVTAANEVREVAQTEHDEIASYCLPRYRSAETTADVEMVDKICLPARAAYYATRIAWNDLVTLLEAAKLGKATDAQVEDAARKLGVAFADLRTAIGALR